MPLDADHAWSEDRVLTGAEVRERGLVDEEVLTARAATLDDGTAAGFDALAARQSYPLPAPAIALAVDAFVRVHGFTVMEVFGQLRPLVMPGRRVLRAAADGGGRPPWACAPDRRRARSWLRHEIGGSPPRSRVEPHSSRGGTSRRLRRAELPSDSSARHAEVSRPGSSTCR